MMLNIELQLVNGRMNVQKVDALDGKGAQCTDLGGGTG